MEVRDLFLCLSDCSSIFDLLHLFKGDKVDSVKVTVRGNIRNKLPLSDPAEANGSDYLGPTTKRATNSATRNGSVSTQSPRSFILIIVNVVWRQVAFTKEPFWVRCTRHTCMQIKALQDNTSTSKQVQRVAAAVGSALTGQKQMSFQGHP